VNGISPTRANDGTCLYPLVFDVYRSCVLLFGQTGSLGCLDPKPQALGRGKQQLALIPFLGLGRGCGIHAFKDRTTASAGRCSAQTPSTHSYQGRTNQTPLITVLTGNVRAKFEQRVLSFQDLRNGGSLCTLATPRHMGTHQYLLVKSQDKQDAAYICS
jgi:hypothetical protein